MYRPHRNSAGERNPGFFPDPFAGFGLGFSAGPPLIHDFFSRDPFDDPFFTTPFGGMFGSGIGSGGGFFGFGSGGFLGSGGLLGHGGFLGHGFSPFPGRNHGFLEQRPFDLQPEIQRGPIIEELEEDHADLSSTHTRSTQEPIVELSDNEANPDGQSCRTRSIMRNHQPNSRPERNFQSHSFYSSSVTYGGSDGAYFTSSTTRAAGPNGVVAEEHYEKDSSGKEDHRLSRGIKNKGRSIARKRNAEGHEETVDTLHNLTGEETGDFEKNWEAAAGSSLPGWTKSRLRGLNSGPRIASRPALEGGPAHTWNGARYA